MFLLTFRILLLSYIFYVFAIGLNVHEANDELKNVTDIIPKDTRTTGGYQESKPSRSSHLELTSGLLKDSANIGGLFSIRTFRDGKCQRDIDPSGLQKMYAMVYMIEKINEDPDFLSNITLGFHIHDYCGDVNEAVASSMDFIMSAKDCSNNENLSDVKAVVGPMHSDSALSVASLLSLFKVPEISPFVTSTDLSDERYNYFLRNVPSDDAQIIAMADIVQHFGWSSVAVFSTDDLGYGVKGSELLSVELQARNICVAYQTRFNAAYTDFDFLDMITNLRNMSNIRVLVTISDDKSILRLLDVFRLNELYGYTWVASEGWAWSPTLAEDRYYKVVQGMLGVSVPSFNDPNFKEYLKRLKPSSNDPFLTQYWEQTHNCSLETLSDVSMCTGNESFSDDDPLLSEALVSPIMDSVKVIAYGLQECNSSEPKQLLRCLKNVSFINENDYRISFKPNGDLATGARYDIINLQPSNGFQPIFPPKLIGSWTENGGLEINKSAIFCTSRDGNCEQNWKDVDINPPESFCSADCKFGSRKHIIWDNMCCWECIPCSNTEYTNTTNALECNKCSYDEVANSSKNGCNKLRPYYFTPKYNNIALITCIVIMIGIAVTVLILIFFIVKRRSTVVHLSCGKLFKFPLLTSIICCFAFVSFLLSPVSSFSCLLSATILFLPIVACEAILLFICFTHKRDSKKAKRYNTWIFFIILSSYTSCVAVGYIIKKPELAKDPDYVKDILVIGCEMNSAISCYSMATVFVLLLDVVGITIAYRTRTTQGNFNEAKFIFYTFIAHTMLWVALILVKVLTSDDINRTHLTSAFGMIGSASIFLACMFFPKLNAYKRKPEARILVGNKRGWKFRRKTKENTSESLIEDSSNTKQHLVDNLNKTIEALKNETMQARRVISLCKDHQRDLRQRFSHSESEILNKLYIIRNAKAELFFSSNYMKTTKC
ncbi:extracellular calcium-sensing receptor-like [Antedon mediterranea]|uniref:extracellular calcium-sensing receptor-like n=1 Tax=Antedon mediterranea TaxID=105859 RepID=UPI003AF42333